MAKLADLSNENLLMICSSSYNHDPLNLIVINRRFYDLIIERIYENVNLYGACRVITFLRSVCRNPQLAAYVSNLRLESWAAGFAKSDTIRIEQTFTKLRVSKASGFRTGQKSVKLGSRDIARFLVSNLPKLTRLILTYGAQFTTIAGAILPNLKVFMV